VVRSPSNHRTTGHAHCGMPFHGLASKIVLTALKDGQRGSIFAGTVQGSVQVNDLAAGHRRWTCSGLEDSWLRFVQSTGESQEASEEALLQRESSDASLLPLSAAARPSHEKSKLVVDVPVHRSEGACQYAPRDTSLIAEAPTHHPGRHPAWEFETNYLHRIQVIICAVVLFFAGILCAAGGIGGGGIYVTLLMVAGSLDVTDAVPMSKTVVFLGSVPSLVLNLRKSFTSSTQTLIDYNICRLVVPSSLMGTFFGVFLNGILPSWSLLLILSVILVFLTAMVIRTTVEQYVEEAAGAEEESRGKKAELRGKAPADAVPAVQEDPARGLVPPDSGRWRRLTSLGRRRVTILPGSGAAGVVGAGSPVASADIVVEAEPQSPSPLASKTRNNLTAQDVVVSICVLVLVVVAGIFHHHAGLCKNAVSPLMQREACHHPALFFLGRGTLQEWMHQGEAAELLMALAVILPCAVCLGVTMYYSFNLIRFEGWDCASALAYDLMGLVTGCLAGLVGIGGGLIYSPFFLLMNVDPGIGVATSSTCVIFTSSSTFLQYLFTDRVIVSLAVVYGLVNVVASYVGTSCVHFLMEDFHTRRSYISTIVALGVLISTVLALVKLGMAAAAAGSES